MNRVAGLLRLLFLSFFLLVLVAAGGTVWGLQAQSSDALVINLAGRQRMLVQWLTRLAASPELAPGEQETLVNAAEAFDETLNAFQFGGQVRYPGDRPADIPPAGEAGVREQLTRVAELWRPFRASLEVIRSAPAAGPDYRAAQAEVKSISPALVSEADVLVRLYQEASDRRLARLTRLQAGYFGAAVLLLLAGGLVVQRWLLRPLKALDASAERIGAGDLGTPVPAAGPVEIRLLAETLEGMRLRLRASHQELEGRVALRTQELEALYEVSRDISSRLEIQDVLQSITTKARELLTADLAFLCLIDESGGSLKLRALSGPQEMARQPYAPLGNLFVQSVLSDPCARHCAAGSCPGTCGIMDADYRASHLAVSLWVENRVIGALCVGSRQPGRFSDEAQQLLTRLASAAAVAIENARLYGQAERLAALEERGRIAAEMHDGLAQMVDSLGLLVDQAGDQLEAGSPEAAQRTLETTRDRIQKVAQEVRRSIAGLQEEEPLPDSLQARLAALLGEIQAQDGEGIRWRADLPGEDYILEEDARQVLGIAQEALTNARRYAGAGQICLSLVCGPEEAVLRVEDDGCGFDPHTLPEDGRQHFGLKILQARAAQLQGRLQIASAPDRGTAVRLGWRLRRPGFTPAAGARDTEAETDLRAALT